MAGKGYYNINIITDNGVFDKTIKGADFVIGSSKKSNLILKVPGVSRKHLKIAQINGQTYIEDLHSSNGTLLDGVPMDPGIPIKYTGQKIKIGIDEVVITLVRVTEKMDNDLLDLAPKEYRPSKSDSTGSERVPAEISSPAFENIDKLLEEDNQNYKPEAKVNHEMPIDRSGSIDISGQLEINKILANEVTDLKDNIDEMRSKVKKTKNEQDKIENEIKDLEKKKKEIIYELEELKKDHEHFEKKAKKSLEKEFERKREMFESELDEKKEEARKDIEMQRLETAQEIEKKRKQYEVEIEEIRKSEIKKINEQIVNLLSDNESEIKKARIENENFIVQARADSERLLEEAKAHREMILEEAEKSAKKLEKITTAKAKDIEAQAQLFAADMRKSAENELSFYKEKADREANIILEKAQNDAHKLIVEANEKAEFVIKNAFNASVILKNETNEDLTESNFKEIFKDYQKKGNSAYSSLQLQTQEEYAELMRAKTEAIEQKNLLIIEKEKQELLFNAKEEAIELRKDAQQKADNIVREAYVSAKLLTHEADAKLFVLKKEYDEIKSKYEQDKVFYNEDLSDIKNEYHNIKEDIKLLIEQKNELKFIVSDEEKKIIDLKQERDFHQKSLEHDRESIEAKINDLRNKFIEEKRDFEEKKLYHEEELQTIKTEISSKKDKLAENERKLINLKDEVDKIEKDKTAAYEKLQEIHQDILRITSEKELLIDQKKDLEIKSELIMKEAEMRANEMIQRANDKNELKETKLNELEEHLDQRSQEIKNLEKVVAKETEKKQRDADEYYTEMLKKGDKYERDKIQSADSYENEKIKFGDEYYIGKKLEGDQYYNEKLTQANNYYNEKQTEISTKIKEHEINIAQKQSELKEKIKQFNVEKDNYEEKIKERHKIVQDELESGTLKIEKHLEQEYIKLEEATISNEKQAQDRKKEILDKANKEALTIIKNARIHKEKVIEESDKIKKDADVYDKHKRTNADKYHETTIQNTDASANELLDVANKKKKELESEINKRKNNLQIEVEQERLKMMERVQNEETELRKSIKAIKAKGEKEFEERKKEQELELGRIKLKEKEVIEAERQQMRKAEKARVKMQISNIADNLDVLLLDKFEDIKNHHGAIKNVLPSKEIKEIVKYAFATDDVQKDKNLEKALPFNQDAAQKVKDFYKRTGIKIAVGLSVISLIIFSGDIYNGVLNIVSSKQSDSDELLNQIKENKKNKPIFDPAKTDDFKNTFTDNLLYNRGFEIIKLNSEYRKQWTIDLNNFIVNELNLSENAIIPYMSNETNMIREMADIRVKINIDKPEKGIERLREVEANYLPALKNAFNNDPEKWVKYWEFHSKHFSSYRQNNRNLASEQK
ncbi:MAG: FHA domain-containing protein [Halobacteriovoraceae bacterium]|nr:FHA domain-containing protein [Halobacteriovoraceae bacterium]